MSLSEDTFPKVKGLVLAGGHSTRMGRDKGEISWHGKPQREYMVELLEYLGIQTFISCRPDQAEYLAGFKLILDRVAEQGPLGAIYSAFLEDMESAWLVVACDMPLLHAGVIHYLVQHRRPDLAGTAFRSPAFDDPSPDPLFAIWEPQVFPFLEKKLQEGDFRAGRVLMLAGVNLLDLPDSMALTNVNTPEEARLVTLRQDFFCKQ
jgi:molybdopterin-guanine dinucleotide biosynthesis protein A